MDNKNLDNTYLVPIAIVSENLPKKELIKTKGKMFLWVRHWNRTQEIWPQMSYAILGKTLTSL